MLSSCTIKRARVGFLIWSKTCSLNTYTFMINKIFYTLLPLVVVVVVMMMCRAGRERVYSLCNLLVGGVRAALFILLQTPSDSAARGSEEGCSPLITASVINSFIQAGRKQPFSFPQPNIKNTHTHTDRHTQDARSRGPVRVGD